MNKLPVSVLILTYNEEENLEDCLKSVYQWASEIIIVDSHSSDKTVEIGKKYSSTIYQNHFQNQAEQFNWALNNVPIKSDWIMRLDADERVTESLKNELFNRLDSINSEVAGIYVKRKVYFMGRWIQHGSYYPIWLMRIFRKGKAQCEQKNMDEHIRLIDSEALYFEHDIIDDNQKGLSHWVSKHNKYATREMIEILTCGDLTNKNNIPPQLFGKQMQRRRWMKVNLYLRGPLFIRALLYFIYRYFFRLGFLDGKEGLIFHFLQGFWYRFLVDAKIYEIKKKARTENKDVKDVIYELYGISLNK